MVNPEAELPRTAATDGGEPTSPAGDIGTLIARYHGDVYRYAYRLAGNVQDTEDLTQQTFLLAHQRLHQLRDPQAARSWLFAVLRTAYLQSRRRERPVAAASLDLDVDSIAAEDADDEIDRQRLQLALNELSDEHRMILVMFYFEECSYKEIADKLDLSMGTVMSRLSRAKDRLRKLLSHERM